jgi:hypothetical protein
LNPDDLTSRLDYYQRRRAERQAASLDDARALLREFVGRTTGSREGNDLLAGELMELTRQGGGVVLYTGLVASKNASGTMELTQYKNMKIYVSCKKKQTKSFIIKDTHGKHITSSELLPEFKVVSESAAPPSEIQKISAEDASAL